jgi:hypothetical protein
MDYVFDLVSGAGELATSIVVSGDDVREARATGEYGPGATDRDVAVDIYEQRYESALAAIGVTYEQAIERGFTLRIR